MCHSRHEAQQVKAWLASWLAPRGLAFNEDKTHIVTLDEGLVDVRHLRVASGVVRLTPGESVQVLPNMPLVPLAHDRGYIWRQMLKGLEDAVRQAVYQRPGSSTPGGTPTGTPGSTGGVQGDKGKDTGNTTGTSTGTGAPTGAPPAPPPPPPPGGGGE